MSTRIRALAVALVVASTAAADQTVVQIRTQEDPSVPYDATLCGGAPFSTNIHFEGTAWTFSTRKSDGTVVNDSVAKRGAARACAQITNFSFSAFSTVAFLTRFDLPQGTFTGLGLCTVISNRTPKPGLITAACALQLISFPSGFLGGTATSISIFNPFNLPGFATGSYWTLTLFTPSSTPPVGDDGDDKD